MNSIRKIVPTALLVILSFSDGFAQYILRCGKQDIVGYEQEHQRGKAYVGRQTRQTDKVKIYVTEKGNQLFALSNIAIGDGNTMKICETGRPSIYDPIEILSDIVPGFNNMSRSDQLFLIDNVEYTFDPTVLRGRFLNNEFKLIKKPRFICPDGVVRNGEIASVNGVFTPTVVINSTVTVRVLDPNFKSVIKALNSENSLNYDAVKILSLVDNTDTRVRIAEKYAEKNISFDFSSEEKLKDLLLQNSENTILLLGHLHDGVFVTKSGGEEVFRIPIATIQGWQKEHGLNIAYLGCNAALEAEIPGAITKFNSLEILDRLETTKRTKSNKEFLDSLGFRTTRFIVDYTLFRTHVNSQKQNVKASVVSMLNSNSYSMNEGNLFGRIILSKYHKLIDKIKRK